MIEKSHAHLLLFYRKRGLAGWENQGFPRQGDFRSGYSVGVKGGEVVADDKPSSAGQSRRKRKNLVSRALFQGRRNEGKSRSMSLARGEPKEQ